MSGLHQAVARAIAGVWDDPATDNVDDAELQRLAATAAVRVCLAEAQRAVAAERAPLGSRRAAESHNHGIERALAALAALAEDEA